MLLGGKKLLTEGWRNYPKEVPILLFHGSGDRVTAFDATKSFEEKVVADDKKFIVRLFERITWQELNPRVVL